MVTDNIEELQEIEIIYEVRGRGDSWKVFYPDEGDIKTGFPLYDKDGKFKHFVYAGGDSGKLTESSIVHSTAKQAIKYAKELGAEKIKLIKSKPKKNKEYESL